MTDKLHTLFTVADGIHIVQSWSLATYAERAALELVASDVGRVAFVAEDNQFWILTDDDGGEGPVWFSLTDTAEPWTEDLVYRATSRTVAAKTFAGAMTFDLTTALHWACTLITSDFTIALANGEDGDEFTIALPQATGTPRSITAVTATGRTMLMRNDLTQLNTAAFLVASSRNMLVGRFETLNGTPVVFLDLVTGTPLVVGAQSFATRVDALLGSHQIETWDAALGVTVVSGGVDAWVGQKQSTSLPAVTLGTGPVYSASDAAFGGKPSITGALGKAFRKTGLSGFMANGSKPYLWAVARMPTLIVDAVQHILIDYGKAGVSDNAKINTLGTATTSDISTVNSSGTATNTSPGTSAIFVESWCDSGGTTHLAFGGVDVATASGAAINQAIDAIGIFVAASTAGVQYGAFALAAHGCCDIVPSAPDRAALYALAQSEYGV